MTDPLYTGDLDLGSVTTHEQLTAYLRIVHIRADNLSLRTLEIRTRHGPTPLSRTVVSEMLKGIRFPRKERMVAFLRTCGVPDNEIKLWQQAWDRLALESGVSRSKFATQTLGENQRRREHRDQQAAKYSPRSGDLAGDKEVRRHLISQSIWYFRDDSAITLVSTRVPRDRRPPSADRSNLNYVHYAAFADLDALFDIHGAIRAYNPVSQVAIKAAEDLEQLDLLGHLVLVGGLTWEKITPSFSRILPIPIDRGDPYDRGAIVVYDADGAEHEFKYTLVDGELVEDVGFFVRAENPSMPDRTLTICGGITTRGVWGAARCFIDPGIRERNERYLMHHFSVGSTYCIVMRVPVFNQNALASDLTKKENILFEWSQAS